MELLLEIGRLAGGQLFQRRLDPLLILGRGPNHDAPCLGIDDEFRIREQRADELGNGGRIGSRTAVRCQLQLFRRRHFTFQLLDQLGDLDLFDGPGPDRHGAGIVVAQDLQARHVGLQRRQHRFEPPALGGGDGVHSQRARLFRRRVRLELLDNPLNHLVICFCRDGNQPLVLCIRGQLRVRHHFFEDVQQALRRRCQQEMEADRHSGIRAARLQLLQRAADQQLVRGNGQRHQGACLGIQRQLGFGNKLLQQRQRGVGIRPRQAMHLELRRVFGRGTLAQPFQGSPHDLVVFGHRPDNQVLYLAIDRKAGVGHQGLQRGDQRSRLDGRGEAMDRIRLETRLFVCGRRGAQLFQRGSDLLVIRGRRDGDQPLLRRIRGQLGAGNQLLQQREGRGGIGGPQGVDFHHARVIGRLVQSQLLQRGLDALLLVRGGIDDQAALRDVDRQLGLGHRGLQLREQRVGGGDCFRTAQLVGLEMELLVGRRLGLQLFQGRLDPFVLVRRGDDGEPLLDRIRRELGGGDQLLEQGHGGCRVGGSQRIHFHDAGIVGRLFQPQLFQSRLDQLLLGSRSVNNQPVGADVERDLGLGHQGLHLRKQRFVRRHRSRPNLVGLELQRVTLARGSFRLQLVQRGANRRLIRGFGQRDQAAGTFVVAELGVRHQFFEHLDQLRRIHAGQPIDFELGGFGGIARRSPAQLVHRRANRLVFGRRRPGDQQGLVGLPR